MANKKDKHMQDQSSLNPQKKQFSNPQQGQPGKQGSTFGENRGMKQGQPSHQGKDPKQGSTTGQPTQYSEATDDESIKRGKGANVDDPNKKWSPTSGSNDF